MTTEFGYTEQGEYLPIVTEPFLTIPISREMLTEDQESWGYLIRAAQKDAGNITHGCAWWTARISWLWDGVFLECWMTRG